MVVCRYEFMSLIEMSGLSDVSASFFSTNQIAGKLIFALTRKKFRPFLTPISSESIIIIEQSNSFAFCS